MQITEDAPSRPAGCPTGQSWCDPAGLKAKCCFTTVEPGARIAKGPFVAETFPVSVEPAYVVVDI